MNQPRSTQLNSALARTASSLLIAAMASGVIARPTLALAQERPVAFVPYAGDESASTPVEQTATNPSVSPRPTPGESEPAPSAHQTAKPSSETVAQEVRNGAPARVVVSSEGVPMVVNQITAESNAFGRGYAYGRVVSVSMTARDWNMICQSPCEFTVAPGTIALVFNGEGAMPAEEHVSLVSGDNYIHVSPGSRALRNVQILTGVFGIIALTFGGTLLLLSYARDEEDKVDKNYLKYGIGLSAAGGGLIVGSWVLSSFTETEIKWGPGTGPGAPRTSNNSGRVGLSLRSAF